jgi:hypothetical protein
MLSRWADFARFLDDGRICLTNNAAERASRGVASATCRLNDVDPKVWLADVLARISDLPSSRLHELLPWEWKNVARQSGREAVLPHVTMFLEIRALPHPFCSQLGAKEAGRGDGRDFAAPGLLSERHGASV